MRKKPGRVGKRLAKKLAGQYYRWLYLGGRRPRALFRRLPKFACARPV